MPQPFDDLIKNLYLPYFNEVGEKAIPFFVNTSVGKMAFLSAYKTLEPIESMPENEKKEMWKYVNDLFPDKSEEEKLEACKIVYSLGNLL